MSVRPIALYAPEPSAARREALRCSHDGFLRFFFRLLGGDLVSAYFSNGSNEGVGGVGRGEDLYPGSGFCFSWFRARGTTGK